MLTVITDASFHPSTGVGAWAFWSKDTVGTIRKAAYHFKELQRTSDACEFLAIVNALAMLEAEGVFKEKLNHRITLQADNIIALGWALTHPKVSLARRSVDTTVKPTPMLVPRHINNRSFRIFHEILTRYSLDLRIRHVKAHKGTATTRTSVHDWCDQAAKEARRKREKIISSSENTA